MANAIGHLVGIGLPEDYGYDRWDMKTLPMIPEFKLTALQKNRKQTKFLKTLFMRDDVTEIINACDAGREGECIFRYIYNYCGCKKPVKRLWINSLTDEAIKDGMNRLHDSKEFDDLYAAGYARAKCDWIFGMNLSRLYGIKYDKHHRVGRVKTPLLNIITKRDEQIAAFKKKPYYKLFLDNNAECSRTFDTKDEAGEVAQKCLGKTAMVISAKSEKKTENRPLLHSLTSLQREANEVYGMTAADTLKAAQSLYEKKLLTYPRTDSSYISADMKDYVKSVVRCLSFYDESRITEMLFQGLNLDKRVINNAKITDHHAIIPTNLIGRLNQTELTDNEKRVAGLVIERFLAALDKPYKYLETRYEFDVDGELFALTTKTALELGWKKHRKAEPDKAPVSYYMGDTIIVDNIEIKDCETKPPAHFTEASLLSVMENIDRLLEDKTLKGYVKERGLGTPATRAAIIEELIEAKYIMRKGKELIATDYGKEFVKSLT